MDKQLFRASALLTGTIIGAGVLGIPYVIAQSGFLTGLLTILILGIALLFMNLFMGEIVLRTPGNHQLPGYAEKYLGKYGKLLAIFSMLFVIYGALVAYIIGEGIALSAIFGLTPLKFSVLFFVFAAIFVYIGLKAITKYELLFASIVLFLILLISGIAIFSGKFDASNLTTFNIAKIMIPYGVILFAFAGIASIPEMKEYLTNDRKKLKKAIILGSLIPIASYILFSFATIAITGINTTEIATIGLGNYLGDSMVIFGNIFAIFAMLTSFLTLALAMKEVYIYDYNIEPVNAWLLTMFIPFIIFLMGANSFIKIIGITGAIAGGLEGILITLMYWKARKKGKRQPEYSLGKKHFLKVFGIALIIIFILGIINELFHFI
jgi:tyrosine-specific transport protein